MYIEIDFTGICSLNQEQTELTVKMSSDEWDSRKQWRQDMEYAASNQNDQINEPIEDALKPLGLTLSEEDHTFNEDNECIIYKVVKI